MEKHQNQVIEEKQSKPLLDLTFFIDSKSKFKVSVYTLTKLIKDELGGSIAFIMSPKVDYVITTSPYFFSNKSIILSKQDRSKAQLISEDYFIVQQKLQPTQRNPINDSYLIGNKQDSVGDHVTKKISVEKDEKEDPLKIIFNPKHIPSVCYGVNEQKQPFFPEEYLILKSNLLSSTIIGKQNTNKFFYLELHQAIDGSFKKFYRIFTQFGRTDEIHKSNSQHRYVNNDLKEAMALYSSIYSQKIESDNGYTEIKMNNITKIGSKLKQSQLKQQKENDVNINIHTKVYNEETGEEEEIGHLSLFQRSYIDTNVSKLMEMIYKEASKCLIKNFSVEITENGIETQLGSLSITQIEEARSVLNEIHRILNNDNGDTSQHLEMLSSKFYQLVPSKISSKKNRDSSQSVINTFESLNQLSEFMNMMKDLTNSFNTNLITNESKNHFDMKYHALDTNIEHLHKSSASYQIFIRNFLLNPIHQISMDSGEIEILNCYRLDKKSEQDTFLDQGNVLYLYHGSKPQNFVGLMSRGILPPDYVKRIGGKRTDFGYLGSGIYFSDDVVSSQYTSPIGERGSRFIFMSTVSLGKVKEFARIQPSLQGPPLGYQSCKGLKSSLTNPTDFKNNEYVIYNPNQTKLSFLIEYIEKKEKK
ncbi:hypothetical protein RB653_007943 [Dictyostelium firmibasis]|uniref:Poly [ADP-ribose] polymerase n=1 Tax=Dictyostelium firmibasis TaxID=79012 RepID=A0AAN7YMF1_9MYCE